MKSSWLKGIARDLFALGSIPFYFLVAIRAIIGNYKPFVNQLAVAAIAIFILWLIIKNSDLHIARSLVALVFVSLFYKETIFTIFAALVWILLLVSAYYIKRKIGFVVRGIIIGIVSSLAGYYIAPYFV